MSGKLQLGLCLPLAIAVVASAVWVTAVKHQARQSFIELEALNREHDRLQVDWGRLQLEESAWAAHPRIETLARERLGLDMPSSQQLVMLAEPPR
ncbi:MAG TPA: cell division protein FtsL [Gammaproteobacteria bacterium]